MNIYSAVSSKTFLVLTLPFRVFFKDDLNFIILLVLGFIAVWAFSLVVASGGDSSLQHMGVSLQWLLLWSTGCRSTGFGRCIVWALGCLSFSSFDTWAQ